MGPGLSSIPMIAMCFFLPASGGVKTTVVVPQNCPPDTHLNWRQANSVKSLRSCYQDKYSRDHTVRPRQIMAIEQSKGNPYSYKPAWRKLGAARAEAVGGEAKWVDPCRHGDDEFHKSCRSRSTLSRHQNWGLVRNLGI